MLIKRVPCVYNIYPIDGIVELKNTNYSSWDYPNPFVLQVSVKENDIDGYQHVNNSVYVRWMDECAREHSKALGIDTADAAELGYGMAVTDSRISYEAAAYLDDEVLVGNWITKCDGRVRATRAFQIVRVADGVTLTRATLNYICIKIRTGRACRMPPLFREKYVMTTHDSAALDID